MAYFANSSEGAYFDSQCDECLQEDPDACCPVWAAQVHGNYAQCNNKEFEATLNCLVNEKGECQMKPIIDELRNKEADRKNEVKLF
ncbi:hypothetical protein KAR91_31160 [Candidatus Pacearchaeota archaeon]|nr:hypothetical protein [Candidatus Pacearchaeota archaeon]